MYPVYPHHSEGIQGDDKSPDAITILDAGIDSFRKLAGKNGSVFHRAYVLFCIMGGHCCSKFHIHYISDSGSVTANASTIHIEMRTSYNTA